MALEEPLILAGDYNVIPEPHDAKDPSQWVTDALFLPQTRAAFRRLENLGFVDAVRATNDETALFLVLGLSGRRLAEEQRHSHRSSDAVARGLRPVASDRYREACARVGKAL